MNNQVKYAPNPFIQRMQSETPQIGLWSSLVSSEATEIFASSTADWVLYDMEHTTAEVRDVLEAARACTASQTELIVRVPSIDESVVKRVLDTGVRTIFFPQIRTVDDVQKAVEAMHFPPVGIRGVSGSPRSLKYGHKKILEPEVLVEPAAIIQIETVEALESIEDIVTVDGVSAIFVGPADLSASLGHMGHSDHEEVRNAILHVANVCKMVGKPVGILAMPQSFAHWSVEHGFDFVAVGQDTSILVKTANALLEEFAR